MSLRDDPTFTRLLGHVSTIANRVGRLTLAMTLLVRKVRTMSQQTDTLAADVAELKGLLPDLKAALEARTAAHADTSAELDATNAAASASADEVKSVTADLKAILSAAQAASVAPATGTTAAAGSSNASDQTGTGETGATEHVIDPITGELVPAADALQQPA